MSYELWVGTLKAKPQNILITHNYLLIMTWTIQNLIHWATGYFSERGIDSPRLDAEVLLGKVLGLTRVQLYTHFDQPLAEEELQAFKVFLKRRALREPLAYIVGEREFFSLSFHVNSQVLIPRPESEGLVERGLTHLGTLKNHPQVMDLATGSGCILIALLKSFPAAQGIGVDVCEEALEIAAKNARRHGVESQVQWIRQDLSQPWSEDLAGPFDLITANLPYISEVEYAQLAPEVRDFEPKNALIPGHEGTEGFDWVLPTLNSRLKPGGLACLEFGAGQAAALSDLVGHYCPQLSPSFQPDLAGHARYLFLSR